MADTADAEPIEQVPAILSGGLRVPAPRDWLSQLGADGWTQAARGDIVPGVSKTSVEIDPDIAREAAAILGTTTLRATVNAALQEVVHAKRRLELVALLSQEGRFDFDLVERAWGAHD